MSIPTDDAEQGVWLPPETVRSATEAVWAEAVPALVDYIRIPAKSAAFDPDWEANGHIAEAVALIRGWCADRLPPGASIDVHQLEGRSPVILIEVDPHGGGGDAETTLLYGHLDKQPEMLGWWEGFGPWTPVLRDDRLYGRGGGDDGYAAFAVVAALAAVHEAGGGHNRCVALIEASEESGSPDLPAYLDALADQLGNVGLVVCLDSGAADYESLWVTTSLRGLVSAHLRAQVLDVGVHSGSAGGVVPSSFRVLRELLDRIEDPRTGEVLVPECHVEIPHYRVDEATATVAGGVDIREDFPWAPGTRPMSDDPAELLLATTWRPSLSYVGIDGIPSVADGGNVLRPDTTLALSFRLPPTCDPDAAAEALKRVLEADPPSGASVSCDIVETGWGWNAAPARPWLAQALESASTAHFGRPARFFGEGGSIPFMAMLGQRYPAAQFVITGVLGPGSNAHGPNEYLDIPTAQRVSACVAHVLHAATQR